MKWVQRNLSKCVCNLLLSAILTPVFAFGALNKTPPEKSKVRTSILPLVTFYSSFDEGEVYNWWAENSSTGEMKELFEKWYGSLVRQPLTKWEYPTTLQKDANIELQVSAMTIEKKIEFAKQKSSALMLTGDIRIDPSPLIQQGVRWTQKLEVYRVKNGQKVAETLRIFDINRQQYLHLQLALGDSREFMANTVADIHQQIESYKPEKAEAGTKLILTGSLSGEQMNKIKEHLRSVVHGSNAGARDVQIVSYERNQVVFEIPVLSSERLGQALVEFHWKGFITQVISSDSSQVVFDVQSKISLQ